MEPENNLLDAELIDVNNDGYDDLLVGFGGAVVIAHGKCMRV